MFEWQRERGITSLFRHDVRERGIVDGIRKALEVVGDGPTFLTVDVDVLDAAFAPGTGTPEPGGIGSSDITALGAARTVHETLTGLALAPAGRPVDIHRGASTLTE